VTSDFVQVFGAERGGGMSAAYVPQSGSNGAAAWRSLMSSPSCLAVILSRTRSLMSSH